MKPRTLYLLLTVVGTLLPVARVLISLRQHGLDSVFLDELYAMWAAGVLGTGVLLASPALWAFIYFEGRRSRMKRLWVPVAANLMIGVSLALPLFLYMREVRLQGSMWSGGRCEV